MGTREAFPHISRVPAFQKPGVPVWEAVDFANFSLLGFLELPTSSC